MVWVQIPASTPYVGLVCCWFFFLFPEVFLRVLRFSPFLKNQHSQIQIRPRIRYMYMKNHHVDMLPHNRVLVIHSFIHSFAHSSVYSFVHLSIYLFIFIYLFIYLIPYLHNHTAQFASKWSGATLRVEFEQILL